MCVGLRVWMRGQRKDLIFSIDSSVRLSGRSSFVYFVYFDAKTTQRVMPA